MKGLHCSFHDPLKALMGFSIYGIFSNLCRIFSSVNHGTEIKGSSHSHFCVIETMFLTDALFIRPAKLKTILT